MTVLIVQCRISSSRLPGKALLDLDGRTVLDWNLAAMKKVPADEYYVATDSESFKDLAPIAERNGFKIFEGPLEDVLERFCLLIEKTKADTVIRATADNPFLFYDAASSLLDEYKSRTQSGKCDYITWTGLPHGSGVEIFNASSLLEAKKHTNLPYDHEHVGPALYNHSDLFTSLMLAAPKQWNHPDLRTTIDTPADYRRARAIVSAVKKIRSEKNESISAAEPFTSEEIIHACNQDNVSHPVLCVPCVKKGKGTGHLRRCLSVALSIGCDVYISEDADLEEKDELISNALHDGLEPSQIVSKLPQKGDYSLIVTDAFSLSRELALALASAAPVVAIDEGSLNTDVCDVLLDIIPSYGIDRPANVSDPSFVTLPKNKRSAPRLQSSSDINTILITVGGEDPSDLVIPAAQAFAPSQKHITAIVENPQESQKRLGEDCKNVRLIEPVHNLREQLADYDLVITHYGFTAFEALAAGCAVILLGTSSLHLQLAQKYGFVSLSQSDLAPSQALPLLEDVNALYPDSPFVKDGAGGKDLGAFVQKLARGRRFSCPVCRDTNPALDNPVVARIAERTFRRCSDCGMLYMAWTGDSDDKNYDQQYFFEGYKKQYGKTYLDDFASIKAQCIRRTSNVDQIYRRFHKTVTPTVLDIGCAFGPYLDAASDAGWQVFGTDISEEAVKYVQDTLHYPASRSAFPAFDSAAEFGVPSFDAVTMWYVIEHFQDLHSVLKAVSKIVKTGGIFAFSTPSASGVSARFSPQKFFQQSPSDHFTLWEPARASSILKRYGFKVCKIVYTGHHPERFPSIAKSKAKPNSLQFSIVSAVSHFFGLGDTFEVYCVKEKDVHYE